MFLGWGNNFSVFFHSYQHCPGTMDHSAAAAGVVGSSDIGPQKDRVVTEEEWLQKWEMGNIGFHKEQGHPYVTSLFGLSC